MMVCRIGRGSTPPPDLLIDDCEVAWTSSAGLLRTVNATPTAGGSGYTAGDILDVTTGGVGGKVQVSTVDGGGAVTALVTAAYAGGFGTYTTGTGKATTGGTGTGCTVNITQINSPTLALDAAVFHDGAASNMVQSISIPARSLVAYRAISPGDLTAYSRLKAWIQTANPNMTADLWRLCLCSDAFGRDVVDEFSSPFVGGDDAWVEMNAARIGAGSLASAYGSVALYRGIVAWSSPGFFYLDNIRVSA